jgi:hypothetical protein
MLVEISMAGHRGRGCKKGRIPAHVFKICPYCCFLAKILNIMAGKCSLMDAFGRQKSGCLGGSTVKGKGRAVLGPGFFPKNLGRLALFPNIFSVGDLSS